MLKRILSVIAGAGMAVGIIMGVEYLSGKVYPPPSNMEEVMKNPELLRKTMEAMPVNAYLLILAGWMLGCLAGGALASLVSGRETARASLMVGIIILAGGIMNTMDLPGQPMWFLVTSFVLYIPFAYLGHLLVRKKKVVI